MKLIIGVDEAGRGPLAGPVTLSAFCAPSNLRAKLIKILGGKIKDSKQLSPQRRASIFKQFQKLKLAGSVNFSAAHSSPKIIDKIGISKSISKALANCLKKLHRKDKRYRGHLCTIKLDGLLKAPSEYKNQKTIVGGDAKDIFIACASIVAKVTRDQIMCRLSKKHPDYGFEIHKGYSTKSHAGFIRKYGLSSIHRKSFCFKIFN